jgi:hypothetical protein
MEHRRELNAEFSARVNSNTKLKSFAHAGSFHTWTYAAPKGCVEKDHIDGRIQNVCGKLFEIDDHSVGRERHPHLLASPTHAVQAKYRVFEIVIIDVLDLLAKPDCLLG